MQSKGSLTGQRLWLLQLVVLMVVVSVGVVSGYPGGPPLHSCSHMYPTGHHANAKTITPPYILSATPTTISAGTTVTVNLVATGDKTYPYYEGVFVQARKADCQNESPIGTFSVAANHPFLKLMDCGGKTASAVAHKTSKPHQTNNTFTWTVPKDYQGRVYFRATVVKNEKTFWTDVFSPYLTYSNDTSAAPAQYCPVQSKDSSSVSALTASLLFVVFVTSFAFFCKL